MNENKYKTSDFEVVIHDKQVSAINVKHASTKENLYKLITEFVTNKRGEGGKYGKAFVAQ